MLRQGFLVALASFSLFSMNSYASYRVDYYSDGEAYSFSSQDKVVHHTYKRVTHRYTQRTQQTYVHPVPYASRLPDRIPASGEKMVVVNPNVHVWGAYAPDGKLVRAGLATAGSKWCPDLGRPCRTTAGSFRVNSLGSADCYSRKFPVGEGGAPMPYCMYFNGSQGLHGSNELAEANISHGCVRMSVSDAAWLRFNFVHVGTKVVVKAY